MRAGRSSGRPGHEREGRTTATVSAHFEEQAGFCEAMGSPFTARLLEELRRELEAGGIVADLVGRWPGDPRADAVSLRLAGALHAAALSGRDASLAASWSRGMCPDLTIETEWTGPAPATV